MTPVKSTDKGTGNSLSLKLIKQLSLTAIFESSKFFIGRTGQNDDNTIMQRQKDLMFEYSLTFEYNPTLSTAVCFIKVKVHK